jgi:hypothetical protein
VRRLAAAFESGAKAPHSEGRRMLLLELILLLLAATAALELLARRIEEYRRLRRAMLDAERAELIRLRDKDVINDDVLRRVQRDLDLEVLLLTD